MIKMRGYTLLVYKFLGGSSGRTTLTHGLSGTVCSASIHERRKAARANGLCRTFIRPLRISTYGLEWIQIAGRIARRVYPL